MSDGITPWVTVLLRLPVFYNPDARGHRVPIEDDKFLETANEIARRFGGGTLFVFRHDPPRGFWWIKASSTEMCWHWLKSTRPTRANRATGCELTRTTFFGSGSGKRPSI